MKYNNEYTNLLNNLDTSEEFKKKLIDEIKKEDLKKGITSMKLKNKIIAIMTALGIITCSGVAYATVVPQEIKDMINYKIHAFFGIEMGYYDDSPSGFQEETLENVFTSEKEDIEKYTQLTDAETFGIGDNTEGTLLESNYKQYDWNIYYDEQENVAKKDLQKYEDIIKIKLGMVNYNCLEKLDNETTTFDNEGNVIERKELSIEEILKYQDKEFKTNWDNYYYGITF